MRTKSTSVSVDPEVFTWLRKSAGWSIEDVSRKLGTSVDIVNKIEKGERAPTMKQIRTLSAAYKRPFSAFLLPHPKDESPLPKDYRMLPGKNNIFDKKTLLVIRKARNLQTITKELLLNNSESTKPLVTRKKISANFLQLAKEYRKELGLDEKTQRKCKTGYDLFNYLRGKLEDLNVFVFQYSMPIDDARGFALVDREPNVIVVNTKDPIEARTFTLMHEFAHVILGESAIGMPDPFSPAKNEIERWCDAFSAAFLLPDDMAIKSFEEFSGSLTDTRTLNTLSNRFCVSKAVVINKMESLGKISKAKKTEVLGRYDPKRQKATTKKKGRGGSVSTEKRVLSEKGVRFVSIVANNFDKRNITYTDALGYLSVKSNKFEKVLNKAQK